MKVRNLAELRDMQASGQVKNVEGVKFVGEKPAAPTQPPQDLEPLVAAIRASMDNAQKLSRENTQALYALVTNLAKQQVQAPLERPRRWVFKVVRNEDGFVQEIIAEC